jgi:hypothetical protein
VRTSPRLRGLPVFGFAVAGLLLGHSFSYLVAYRDPHHRDLILERTGHGYLPAATDVALMIAIAGVVALVVRAWSARGRRDTSAFASVAIALAVVQVGAFAGQEVLERLVAGAPLGDLVHDHLLAIGIVVQVAVAVAGAAVLRWTSRTVTRLADALPLPVTAPRPVLVATIPSVAQAPRERVVALARNVRAPPS